MRKPLEYRFNFGVCRSERSCAGGGDPAPVGRQAELCGNPHGAGGRRDRQIGGGAGLAREQAEWFAVLRAARRSVGDLVARLALALQHAAGVDGTLAWSGPTDDPDIVEVFYSYSNEDIGVEAGEVACDMLCGDRPTLSGCPGGSSRPRQRRRRFSGLCRKAFARSPRLWNWCVRLQARDIPVYRLNDASLIQVGQGKYQQRIEAALTSKTSHRRWKSRRTRISPTGCLPISASPAPKQRSFYDVDEAISAADRIGYPVVIAA